MVDTHVSVVAQLQIKGIHVGFDIRIHILFLALAFSTLMKGETISKVYNLYKFI